MTMTGSDYRATMTERALQACVIELAKCTGWLAYHTYDSRRSQPGFPDLVLVRGPRLLFIELKTQRGRLKLEQQAWLDVLGGVAAFAEHVEVHMWRPSDFDNGTIRKALL